MEKLLFDISEEGWGGRPGTAWEFRYMPGLRPPIDSGSKNLVTHSRPPRLHRLISKDHDNPDDSVELSPARRNELSA